MIATPADRLTVVIPLFNDWEPLGLLLERVSQVVEPALRDRLEFLIVDDCSTTDFTKLPTGIGRSLSVLRLFRNVGHQKAIALGLSYLAAQPEPTSVIVMDSDGEDQPEDMAKLLAGAAAEPGRIVFARRTKRHETLMFRTFYVLYKFIFRLMTGKVITFGQLQFHSGHTGTQTSPRLRNLESLSGRGYPVATALYGCAYRAGPTAGR